MTAGPPPEPAAGETGQPTAADPTHPPGGNAPAGDDGVDVVTFGCRLNAYESQVIRDRAAEAGLTGAVVINTCAVTAEAERQARQAIRRARRQRPDARLIVTGCAAQIAPDSFAAMPEVDRVIGNDAKLTAAAFQPDRTEPVLVNDLFSMRDTASHLTDATQTKPTRTGPTGTGPTVTGPTGTTSTGIVPVPVDRPPVTGPEGRVRAVVQIQNGCDHRCTFCIIPFGRGDSRSVPLGAIVRQVRSLVEGGYREVVLTGVDLTAYGADLPGRPTLGSMVRRLLAQVPALPRLRLSSIDPAEIDDALWRLIADEPRLMPHLHLSLQSGDDMVLKRMKRRHSRQQALDFCHRARALRPDIAFGADIIAGFPTETDMMFDNTLAFVSEADLAWLHVFPFSPRPGTPAARMPMVPAAERKARAARLRTAGAAAAARLMAGLVGTAAPVLIERAENGTATGRCPRFAPVTVAAAAAPGAAPGALVPVRFTGSDGTALRGSIAAPACPACPA